MKEGRIASPAAVRMLGGISAFFILSVFIYLFADFQASRHRHYDSLDRNFQALAAATEEYFRKYLQVLQAVGEAPVVKNRDLKGCELLFSRLKLLFPEAVNFAIHDEKGGLIASALPFDRARAPSVRNLDYFESLRKGGSFHIMNPHWEPLSREKVTGIIIPLFGPKGPPAGYLAVSLRFSEMEQLWHGTTANMAGGVIFADRQSLIHFASDGLPKGLVGRRLSEIGLESSAGTYPKEVRLESRTFAVQVRNHPTSGLIMVGLLPGYGFFHAYLKGHPQVLYLGMAFLIALAGGLLFLLRGQRYAGRWLKAEERSRRLMELLRETHFAFAAASAFTNRLELANEALARLFGYGLSELKAFELRLLFAPAARPSAEKELSLVNGKGERRFETLMLRRDGTTFPAEVAISSLRGSEGRIVTHVVSVQDITERREREARLGRLTQLYAILSKVNEAVIRCRKAEELYRQTCRILVEEGLFGMACLTLLDETGSFLETVAASGQGKIPLSTSAIPLAAGQVAEATREGRCVLCDDLQKDQRSFPYGQEALRLGLRSFASLAIRGKQGVIGSLNLYGSQAGLFPEGSQELELLKTLADDLSFAVAALQTEEERRRAVEGLERLSDYLEEKVQDRTKELTESKAALMKVVEELNRKGRDLAAANERLQELDRLKSLFLASMSHELRTPLNSIIGFTGILLMGMSGELNEVQKKQLGMVRKSANHLLSLINDVIDISKIESGRTEFSFESFPLRPLVEEVRESLAVAAGQKGLSLEMEEREGLIVHSDRRRLRQILINLVSNGLKFTETGSVSLRAASEGSDLFITVSDTGIGIKKEDLGRLFTAFSRVHMNQRPPVEGTGLGLYLSQRIASLLGGRITVESEPGKGSSFTLFLPEVIRREQP